MDAAALQQQLADLMAVVNEERELQRQAEAARLAAEDGQQQAEAALQQAAAQPNDPNTPQAQPAAPPPGRGPKIGVPDKYDGARGSKAEVYANQVSLYIVANPTAFPDDKSKVVFALSYLSGKASSWAQPMLIKVCHNQPITYHELTQAFEAMFYDTEKQANAERALRLLKQTRSVADYTHQFTIYAHDAGWEATTLVSQY